jgi:hypothetical protein
MPKLAKGARLFFEGLLYTVIETPTEPPEGKRQTRLGHFLAVGQNGAKRPTVESHPKHLLFLEPGKAQEELDAEASQWASAYATEPDPALKKALQSTAGGNAREASAAVAKIKTGFFYLPGRLIKPPAPRPAVAVSRRSTSPSTTRRRKPEEF